MLLIFRAGNMYNMRDRLLKQAELQHNASDEQLKKQFSNTAELAATLVKLERAEEQLRSLQATLIAEQVARTQIEREADQGREDNQDCKDELAKAVRALRRARDEGQKGDEERRRLARCFEQTKNQSVDVFPLVLEIQNLTQDTGYTSITKS